MAVFFRDPKKSHAISTSKLCLNSSSAIFQKKKLSTFHLTNVDDRAVPCNVPVFLLSDDDNAAATFAMFNRTRGPRVRGYYANNSPIFPIFLQVLVLN